MERQDETQSFLPKLVEKLSLGRSYFVFVKFSFPVTRLMSYYTETGWPISPPNRVTLLQ
jgi:hypothetical protein